MLTAAVPTTAYGERVDVRAATPALTTLTISVRGCLGKCTVEMMNDVALLNGGEHWAAGPTKITRTSRYVVFTFRVPRYRTKGAYFALYDPKAGATNAVTLIVTRYKGAKIGATVSAKAAAGGKYASMCWAGTTRPSAQLGVTVGHFTAPRFPDNKIATMDRPYFTPTLQGYGKRTPTWRGTVLVQDWITCS